MDEKIEVALTRADTTLLLESLAYRLMSLEATATNPPSTARAVKKEAIVAIMSALDAARRTAAPVLGVSNRIA